MKELSSDPLGKALKAFHYERDATPLKVNTNYGEPEIMRVESLYRTRENIPDYEWVMIDLAHGRTLDLGAGCGSHALLLQEKDLEVIALENSESACEVALNRGVANVININFENYSSEKFDTITMVMNGIGILGTLEGFKNGLKKFAEMLNPGGQIIFDTTDISYLNRKMTTNLYFGEVLFQFDYKGEQGDWFEWLYLDDVTLRKVCGSMGWSRQIAYHDSDDHFVVRMQPIE